MPLSLSAGWRPGLCGLGCGVTPRPEAGRGTCSAVVAEVMVSVAMDRFPMITALGRCQGRVVGWGEFMHAARRPACRRSDRPATPRAGSRKLGNWAGPAWTQQGSRSARGEVGCFFRCCHLKRGRSESGSSAKAPSPLRALMLGGPAPAGVGRGRGHRFDWTAVTTLCHFRAIGDWGRAAGRGFSS